MKRVRLIHMIMCMVNVLHLTFEECDGPSWGIGCENHCGRNCEECAVLNGSCVTCAAGWQLSNSEDCLDECPTLTFGRGCNSSCETKCGQDCANKSTGACPRPLPAGDSGLTRYWNKAKPAITISICISVGLVVLFLFYKHCCKKRPKALTLQDLREVVAHNPYMSKSRKSDKKNEEESETSSDEDDDDDGNVD